MRREEKEAETKTRGNSLQFDPEGANGPLDQRSDYKEAKETCNKLYKEYEATAGCGNTIIHPRT